MKQILVPFFLVSISIPLLILVSGYRFKNKQEPLSLEYNLSEPEKSFTLPEVLNEISGITTINQNEIACVQDEIGSIFIYDLKQAAIVKEYGSNLIGDYEELALVDKTMYLLRSDGVIIEQENYTNRTVKINEYKLNLPSNNNEGLCYDKKHNRLLIAAKSQAGKGEKNKEIRLVYGFDLNTKTLTPEPIFKLSIGKIEATALSKNFRIPIKTIKKTGREVSEFSFRPSAIAIHPFSQLIYILSSKDKFLLIMDQNGEIIDLFALDPLLFKKAEGITFLPNGDMLISNEAQKGEPTLLKFKYYRK